tara:strand:+ start:14611 stop:16104 length:1494 start_codon:yes stop_codon:yes gene_type:complete
MAYPGVQPLALDSTKPIVLCDVDKTLTDPKSNNYNLNLMAAFKSCGLTNNFFLFTAYGVEALAARLRNYAEIKPEQGSDTRIIVIDYLKRNYGINVIDVITTYDPYFSQLIRQSDMPSPPPTTDTYYRSVIKPIEAACINLEDGNAVTTYLEPNETFIRYLKCEEQLKQNIIPTQYPNIKGAMFHYFVGYYLPKRQITPSTFRYLFVDDKPDYLAEVQAMSETYGDRVMNIEALDPNSGRIKTQADYEASFQWAIKTTWWWKMPRQEWAVTDALHSWWQSATPLALAQRCYTPEFHPNDFYYLAEHYKKTEQLHTAVIFYKPYIIYDGKIRTSVMLSDLLNDNLVLKNLYDIQTTIYNCQNYFDHDPPTELPINNLVNIFREAHPLFFNMIINVNDRTMMVRLLIYYIVLTAAILDSTSIITTAITTLTRSIQLFTNLLVKLNPTVRHDMETYAALKPLLRELHNKLEEKHVPNRDQQTELKDLLDQADSLIQPTQQ